MITGFVITGSNALANSVEVIGNLAGNATGGPYKVPLRLVYPTGASPVLNRTVIEVWNNSLVEQFGVVGTTIIDYAYLVLDVQRLVEGLGYSYVEHEWNKGLVDQQVATGISNFHAAQTFGALAFPFDPTWRISAGTDSYDIMADVSAFSRNPAAFASFGILPPPPPSGKCFGFGGSQPATLLRQYAMTLRNSTLGAALPNGLVYEGILAALCGSQVRVMDNVAPAFYTAGRVDGATPSSEGVFINLSSESDLFLLQAIGARANPTPAHYAFYEIAGVSHISGNFGNFVRPVENTTVSAPFFKAMLENLRAKVDGAIGLPASQALEGSAATRTVPVFPGVAPLTGIPFSVGSTVNTFIGVPSSDDGNFLGGIRPPHVQTRLNNGTCVGGPLGTYRGVLCLGLSYPDNTLPNAVQLTPSPLILLEGTEPYLMLHGFFSAWDPSLIACRYKDACDYVTFVEAGANYALANRWILPADRDAYVAEAATFTTQGLRNVGLRRKVPPNPPSF